MPISVSFVEAEEGEKPPEKWTEKERLARRPFEPAYYATYNVNKKMKAYNIKIKEEKTKNEALISKVSTLFDNLLTYPEDDEVSQYYKKKPVAKPSFTMRKITMNIDINLESDKEKKVLKLDKDEIKYDKFIWKVDDDEDADEE